MYDSKTVRSDEPILDLTAEDSLYTKQREDVANMRASLLSCNGVDPYSTQIALRNITVMRVYHQISRIIRYTEMMDKIENKLYHSIERSLENMNEGSPSTWMTLLGIQEKLQKCMIDSHKLLQPYLDSEIFSNVVIDSPHEPQQSFATMLIDQESRDKIRSSAQTVLAALNSMNGVGEEVDSHE